MAKRTIMGRIRQNINLLMECQKRLGTKPWYDANRLNALIARLAYLDKDEIDLILDLTERFQFLGLTDLNSKLISAFKKIPSNMLQAVPRILFAPLKSPYHREEKKVEKRRKQERITTNKPILADPGKSSDFIFRVMQCDYPSKFMPYNQKTYLCNKPQDIITHFVKDTLIILWDDFVGSGDTAFTAIADIQKFLADVGKETTEQNYTVVCMCAMQEGIDLLDSFQLKCYASDVYGKAISDDMRFTQEQRDARIAYMKSVESKVVKKAVKNYSLGYHQSEALLSIMDKCPNNTFPFYWFASQYKLEPVFYRLK